MRSFFVRGSMTFRSSVGLRNIYYGIFVLYNSFLERNLNHVSGEKAIMSDLAKLQNPHTEERLRSEIMLWLSSVRPDGHPHLVPVWFLWNGETILIFSKPDQKIRNLRQNPNVVVSLDTAEQGDD